MRQQLVTLLLGEVSRKVRGEMFQPALVTSAPVYTEMAVPRQAIIGQDTVAIDGRQVAFQLRGYAPDVLLIQTRIDVENVFHHPLRTSVIG